MITMVVMMMMKMMMKKMMMINKLPQFITIIFLLGLYQCLNAFTQQYFIEDPQNSTIIQHRNVVLKCRVGYLKGSMQWAKSGTVLGLATDRELMAYPRYKVVGNLMNGESHLHISNVTIQDEGRYECQVSQTTSDPRLRAGAHLQILVPPGNPVINGYSNSSSIIFNGSQSLLTLKCSSGYSKPPTKLTWLKNGVEFHPTLVKYGTIRDPTSIQLSNTESMLSFHPTPSDDGAIITCLSSFEPLKRNAPTTAGLVVYYPPAKLEISGNDAGTPIIAGRVLVLTCLSVGGNPLPNLTWRKENVEMSDQRQVVSGSRVTSQMSFIVSAIDNGVTLTCEATSQASASVIASTKLHIFFPPSRLNMAAQLIGLTTAQENRELTAVCKTDSSNPSPRISWYLVRKDGNGEPKELKDYADSVEDGDHEGYIISSKVKFVPSSLDHGSKIVCRAENLQTGDSLNNSVVLNVAYKPRYVIPQNFSVKIDSVASLSLQVEANPEVHTVTWIRRNQHIGPITSRQPATFLQGDMRLSGGVNVVGKDDQIDPLSHMRNGHIHQATWLNISHVGKDDAGLYVCQAVNSVGKTEIGVFLDVLYPAHITEITRKQYQAVGRPARLECRYNGNPLPTKVQWYRNGVEVTSGGGDNIVISLFSTGGHEGVSKLEYNSVDLEDMGMYQCRVNNGVTEEFDVSEAMEFVVEHVPKIDKSNIYRKAAAAMNGTAKLKCRAHGVPHVDFNWHKVNDSMPINRYHKSDNAPVLSTSSPILIPSNYTYESVLEILDVQPSDFGHYYCVASSSVGNDNFQILLGRPGPPDPPYNVKLLNTTHDSITLSWKAGFDGGSLQTYTVKCYEHSSGQSFDGESNIVGVDNVTSPLETVIYVLRGLKLDTEYWITVNSFNKYGPSNDRVLKPVVAVTSATSPVSDKSQLNMEVSIILYALSSLTIAIVVIISVYCLVRRRYKKSIHDSSINNMGKNKKVSSIETTTTNTTLDLIGTPSLVDDVHFKTLDSLNSSNVNFMNGNVIDYNGRTLTMLPKYACGYDRISQTHSSCDVNKCTDYRPSYPDDDLYGGHVRRCQNNYTPTNSLLSASRTKIAVNPIHLLPSCIVDANDAINRQDGGGSDVTATQCYIPINSCMTTSAVLPDLHSNACTYRPIKDSYPCNTIKTNGSYSPDYNRPFYQPPTSTHPSYHRLPPELRGHLV